MIVHRDIAHVSKAAQRNSFKLLGMLNIYLINLRMEELLSGEWGRHFDISRIYA